MFYENDSGDISIKDGIPDKIEFSSHWWMEDAVFQEKIFCSRIGKKFLKSTFEKGRKRNSQK